MAKIDASSKGFEGEAVELGLGTSKGNTKRWRFSPTGARDSEALTQFHDATGRMSSLPPLLKRSS